MKSFFTLAAVAFSFFMNAQHTATVSPSSDFKTIKNGFVTSVLTLDTELTATEKSEITQWAADNKSILSITVSGKTITTAVSVEGNDRNVYSKMFIQMGIDKLKVTSAGQVTTMDPDKFYDHFNL